MDKKTELAITLGQTIYNNTIRDLQARIDEKTKQEKTVLAAYTVVIESKDAEIKAQAEELKSLRGFAQHIDFIASRNQSWNKQFGLLKAYTQFGLKDENGNPKKLLTGEK